MKQIVIISHNYPSRAMPQNGAFVYNLVQELDKHQSITVIAPFKITDIFKKKGKTYGSENCNVIRPLYLSLGNKKILGLDLYKITTWSHNRARIRGLKAMINRPSLIYCHFLETALGLNEYIKKYNIPLIIASGESSYNNISSRFSKAKLQSFFDIVKFIICVSDSNKRQLEQLGFDLQKMRVIPNAVNLEIFKPKNKTLLKNRLGIENEQFVIGFIGHFIERKGPNRVIEAISQMNRNDVILICVGDGGELRKTNFIRVIPPVPNEFLPDILGAFDVFVLPTLSEGHCNVIEEAKACGIPVISSKGTSVEEQIRDGYNGFLINPQDIREIKERIELLLNKPSLRSEMSNNLILDRGKYSLEIRASLINEIIQKYKID